MKATSPPLQQHGLERGETGQIVPPTLGRLRLQRIGLIGKLSRLVMQGDLAGLPQDGLAQPLQAEQDQKNLQCRKLRVSRDVGQ